MFGEKHENEHLKTKPIKKFKFINRDEVPIKITSDLEYEFNELRECLKSENVDLTMDDILKVFDIYLRVSGIGRSLEDATEFQSIFSQCAPVRCIDPCIDANEEKINNIKNYIKTLNDLASYKLSTLDIVLDNISIIMKEYTIFWNDLVEFMVNQYDKYDCTSYMVRASSEYKPSCVINISILEDNSEEGIGLSLITMSTLLEIKLPTSCALIVDSYPELKKRFEKEKEEKDSE